jgi:hypothetical protein
MSFVSCVNKPDYANILCNILATDQDYQRMSSHLYSWSDMISDEKISEEEIEKLRAEKLKWDMECARLAAIEAEEARLEKEKQRIQAEDDEKYDNATLASEVYWAIHHCKCTVEEIDAMPMLSETPCLCYQKINLDENGEPQECRFFNGPGGCRDGENCFYKHIERDVSEIPCRFEQSEAGCNPGFGRKCPYKHSKIQSPIDYTTITCRFDGHCHPREGICPYKHTITINRIPRNPNAKTWLTK